VVPDRRSISSLKHRFRQEIEQGHIGQAHWIMLSPVNVAKHEQREFSARPFAKYGSNRERVTVVITQARLLLIFTVGQTRAGSCQDAPASR
jgi:hypothetical protein